MTPNAGTLTQLLNAFLTVFNGGWGALQPKAMSLFGILVGIELTLSGLWWALSGSDAIKGLIQKLLVIGLFLFFIQQWQMLTTTTMQSFARAGAAAGGASAAPGSLNLADPSAIVSEGLNAIQPLSDKADELTSGTWTALKNLGTLMQLGLAMIMTLFSFFLIGIQCFLVYLEFYIVAILSLILLPFGVFRPTAFLAEKAFGAVLAHGIKLMVLAFIIAIAQPVLAQITVPVDFSMRDAWCTLLAAMTICFLAWHAPSLAAGLLAGSPTLTTGHVAGAALQAGEAVMLASRLRAAPAAKAAGADNVAGATLKAASSLATGARLGPNSAAQAGAGRFGQALGAVGGAAKAAVSPLKEAIQTRIDAGRDSALKAHGRDGTSAPASPTNRPAAGSDDAPPRNGASPTASAEGASPSSDSSQPKPPQPSRDTHSVASPQTAAAQTRHHDESESAQRMAGESPASRAPTTPDTQNAARIAPGQRRIDDTVTQGLRPNPGASLHRDAAARDGATEATVRAADAARVDNDTPRDTGAVQPSDAPNDDFSTTKE